ncbi:hypothetical protein RDI58_009654 [Solanum bulbocastanum]|uniref:Uncharacterized protein n=1 Tax=Solanum bulbocastanum TaxID=147425 RepID=A0AAN8YIN5_SOLBU
MEPTTSNKSAHSKLKQTTTAGTFKQQHNNLQIATHSTKTHSKRSTAQSDLTRTGKLQNPRAPSSDNQLEQPPVPFTTSFLFFRFSGEPPKTSQNPNNFPSFSRNQTIRSPPPNVFIVPNMS